jgi:hypothetical protein
VTGEGELCGSAALRAHVACLAGGLWRLGAHVACLAGGLWRLGAHVACLAGGFPRAYLAPELAAVTPWKRTSYMRVADCIYRGCFAGRVDQG